MDPDTKATLEVLIREIQDILEREYWSEPDIKELLNSWIKANDLHPENVQHTIEHGTSYYFSKVEE